MQFLKQLSKGFNSYLNNQQKKENKSALVFEFRYFKGSMEKCVFIDIIFNSDSYIPLNPPTQKKHLRR